MITNLPQKMELYRKFNTRMPQEGPKVGTDIQEVMVQYFIAAPSMEVAEEIVQSTGMIARRAHTSILDIKIVPRLKVTKEFVSVSTKPLERGM